MECTQLERGRAAYAAHRWAEAFQALAGADDAESLGADDLELLARAGYMLGRDDDYLHGLERAHQAHFEGGDAGSAARCAWWIGHNLLFRGEGGPARGWFARGERLIDTVGTDCADRGYVRIAAMLEQFMAGDLEAAHTIAVEIADTGARFGEPDLVAIGVMEQGRALIRLGRTADGLRLVDETMVSVTAGELSPIVAGIVYCNTIAFCQAAHELRRAREWTSALTRWCERQPDMVAHNGLCLVHRAELMTIGGIWEAAHAELEAIVGRFTEGVLNQRALGRAAYGEGELHRLRGDADAAEAAYRRASRYGYEPQPGLALVRLAQGDVQAAAAAIRRATREVRDPLGRAALLPAYVAIMVAASDIDAARAGCRELGETAARYSTELLEAWSAQAQGEIALAVGDADAALDSLRTACTRWRELDAPYDRARARALLGLACRALGDEDTCALELDAARGVFEELGARAGLEWLESLGRAPAPDGGDHGLTARELEILRLVASGASNRDVATQLVISERTVARHLQNIFAKLRVSSRTAASAYAFEHDLT